MPSINLRLTDQEHAELEAWAKDGHRSLQKEIIWRLFTIEGNQAPKVGPETTEPRVQHGPTTIVPASGATVTATLPADDHFKPDFKK